MKLRIWHVAVACLLLGILAVGSMIWLWGEAMDAEPTAPELRERERVTARTTRLEEEPPTGPLALSGRLVYADGSPAEEMVVEAFGPSEVRAEVITGYDGSFGLEIEGPAKIRPDDVASRPKEIIARGDRDDLVFVVPYACPLDVRVELPDGSPAEATVQVYVFSELGTGGAGEAMTEDGLAQLPATSCGVATVKARAEGYPLGYRDDVDTVVTQEITMRLVDGVLFEGSVTDGEGEPLDEALINAAHDSISTGPDGLFSMLVNPASLSFTIASKEGYESETAVVRVGADQDYAEHDYVLLPTREVTVYCAGLPEDSCQDVGLIMCTHPWLPFGEPCNPEEDPVVCSCPEGVATVRASAEAVRVEPPDTEVWLDFRYGGGVMGRVLIDGEPAECEAIAVWLPTSNSDLVAGLSAVRMVRCEEDGSFSHVGLRPGSWMVDVRNGGTTRSLGTHLISDAVIDLGDVELQGGGQITGFVLEGLTGEGAPNVPVSAVESGNMKMGVNMPDDLDGTMPNMGNGISRNEGRFTIYGLPDGDYDVFVSTSPFETVSVTVVDGENQGDVELETGGADLLDTHGFGLATADDGAMVVDAVDEGSSAEAAGLQEGDTLTGLRIFGTDPAQVVPGWDDTMTNFILESYDGPGVSLLVDRDGDEIEVDL
ncbi:MAG TPA: hypothetical protein QGF58_25405 [Myxococcota bacterium]|nr:hypothetical protein [Myxococcota bacterium]